MSYNKQLEFAKKLALDAGEVMLKYFNQTDISHYKGDNTIVTKADTEINQMVIDRVREEYPGHGVYGEEDSFGNDRRELWVCDPVDGTATFARGIPVAVFSLAYVVDGKPLIGVVYDPFTKRLYSAMKGGGAFCNDKSIKVNDYQLAQKETAIGCDYSPTMPYDVRKVIYNLSEKNRVGGTGSLVHNSILVATGDFVASICAGDRPYDVAAAKIIVEEAGGKVTDLFGEKQRYDGEIRGAVLSNGIVHSNIVKIIKESK